MSDPAALYADARSRIVELVRRDDVDPATVVPATPDWTVGDVVAHLAGVTADVAAGRVKGAATDPWTAQQVAERKGRSLAESLAEWDEHVGALDAVFAIEMAQTMLVTDVYSHEQDLRGALASPGARDAGLPALRVVAGDTDRVVGEGDPVATLTISPWELVRAATGRRSPAQMRRYDWSGDPDTWLPTLPFLGPRSVDLVE